MRYRRCRDRDACAARVRAQMRQRLLHPSRSMGLGSTRAPRGVRADAVRQSAGMTWRPERA